MHNINTYVCMYAYIFALHKTRKEQTPKSLVTSINTSLEKGRNMVKSQVVVNTQNVLDMFTSVHSICNELRRLTNGLQCEQSALKQIIDKALNNLFEILKDWLLHKKKNDELTLNNEMVIDIWDCLQELEDNETMKKNALDMLFCSRRICLIVDDDESNSTPGSHTTKSILETLSAWKVLVVIVVVVSP
eukprot:m.86420 g.86420  ORF g.86420 m.86420 type:complete len:189 (-) comp13057_c0_seq1:248-814(-)